MEFSEANAEWRPVPDWASFLIQFGFRWLGLARSSRRIAVVSMPSDSAAAGLITLGAMRKCLELNDANDIGSHFQRILELSRKAVPSIHLRYRKHRDLFVLEPVDGQGYAWARNSREPGHRIRINRSCALDWRFSGEPPVVTLNGDKLPNPEFYEQLVANGGAIQPSNLTRSDSGVCLAGRSVGELGTRRCIADVRFRENGYQTDLSQLLTVQNWMPGTVSRVVFFNARTEEFDRGSGRPQLIVADGDVSFLRIVSRQEFGDSDVVGVIHRTMERDKLEAIGVKLANLRQFYDPDSDALAALPPALRGITVSILKRRG